MTNSNKKPITIITGCLGSGKTTLLRKLLKKPELQHNTAVIVNEFGKIGLDHHLLKKTDEKTVLLNGGCICCNNREDLENELKSFLSMDHNKDASINRIIIETTGMADPSPILFTILTNPLLQHHYYIESVVATVDTKNGLLHLKNNPELVKQVIVADKIILTKTDISTLEEKEELMRQLHRINPSCEVHEAIHGDIGIDILKVDHQSLSISKIEAEPLKIENTNHYDSNIKSISFTFNSPLDWTAFGLWLSALLHANGEDVLRVKGLLDVGEDGPIVLNGVQHIIHPPEHLDTWPDNVKHSHLVFILRSIEPMDIEKSLKSFQFFLGTDIEVLELITAL
ncbi:GTP-binding protein [Paenisporosarcina sp. TG20]|uniref:CobW family GTP-binding protein n=1 Tax=Paenisporosarcina sp. TG20 TaxID=1211706 RepID=UPI000308FE15|nr:GTP-binding protein [Paenisporosarcina sp. TG20]